MFASVCEAIGINRHKLLTDMRLLAIDRNDPKLTFSVSKSHQPMITNITENASILQKRIFNCKIKLKLVTCDVERPTF